MPPMILEFLKKHWRFFTVLALVAGSFLLGRFAVPVPSAEVKIQTQVVEKVKLVVDEKRVQEEVDRRVKDIQTEMARHQTTTTVKKPDGTVTTVTTIDTQVKSDQHEAEVKTQVQVVEKVVEKVVDRVVVQKVQVDRPEARWQVGAMVGLFPTQVRFTPLGVQPGPVAIGVQGQLRVAGPLWVGAFGMYQGPVGVTASFQF